MEARCGAQTYLVGDLIDGHIRLAEQSGGFLQTHLSQVLAEGHPSGLAHPLREGGAVGKHALADLVTRDVFVAEVAILHHHGIQLFQERIAFLFFLYETILGRLGIRYYPAYCAP